MDSWRERPFRTAAPHYGSRPPYSAELRPRLAQRLGWDGGGRLLDIGSGPGVIALELAPAFGEVVALDPEPEMLRQGQAASDDPRVRWVLGRAEEIPELDLGSFQAVTMGQSLHRTDRERTLESVHESLQPGGAFCLIHHALRGFGMQELPGFSARTPVGPAGVPPIPYPVIWTALERYLGLTRPVPRPDEERYAALLARSVFGGSEELILPGRPDLVRTPESVVDMFLGSSMAAPQRFGARLDEFRQELIATLAALTPTGTFWDWPGDTEVLLATKS